MPAVGATPKAPRATTAPAVTVASPPPAGLSIAGRGYGHGVGLSQWGALGHTIEGNTWQQILSHYYGGTTLSPATAKDFAPLPSGSLTVRLQGLDGQQTAVTQPQGLATVSGDPVPTRTWASVVVRQLSGTANRYQVWGRTTAACPGTTAALAVPWIVVAAAVTGPVIISTPKGTSPTAAAPADLLGVCETDGDVTYYRGAIEAINDTAGADYTVNVVPLELYLRSVVASEMSGSWGAAAGGAGMNALRSQAVASRSYALSETSTAYPGLKYSFAKTCDTVCEAYRGAGRRAGGLSAPLAVIEAANATKAVSDTAGWVLRGASGTVSHSYYSASNGGRSAAGPYPVVDDPEDATPVNPNFTWQTTVSTSAIVAAWPQIGSFVSATVVAHDGTGGSWGGRVTSVQVSGTKGSVTVTGTQFRSSLGLKSTWFQLTVTPPAP